MAIPKRILLYYSIIMLLIVCGVHVSSKCLVEEESLLLSLKASLTFSTTESVKIVTWNRSSDCCYWKGVACSEDGRVVGLDLSEESISGGLNDLSSLFGLGSLKSLNLAYNDVRLAPIPSRLDELVNLTYLNLSRAGFSGQIPIGISRLRSLVVLDLSDQILEDNTLMLESPNLRTLVQNLSELQELHLDRVDIYTSRGEEWCQALSSSLPKLKVLSLSRCGLPGPIHSSLSKLTSLTTLRVALADLRGIFPQEIFQIPTLQHIELWDNPMLQGSLPEFPRNGGSLETLDLRSTNFSGRLPESIGALRNLSILSLEDCSFSGLIPKSFSNLTQLLEVDLPFNSFSGLIPKSLSNLTQLTYLDLSRNSFSGPIPSFSQSKNLEWLDLSHNNLSGSILNSTHWETLSQLTDLHLKNNSLTGTIPSSLFSLPFLGYIVLSHNRFTDICIDDDDDDGFTNHSSPLVSLDLSNNKISGKLPSNLFRNLESLIDLNLSYNSLEHLGRHALSNLYNLAYVDLSHNRLQGELPIFPPNLFYLDLSVNNFNSAIPPNLFYSVVANLSNIMFLSLASNNLQGSIPESICNASSSPRFEILDLSNNSLIGTIPPCLIMLTSRNLKVMNIGMNNLRGTISDAFPENCTLRTLNLNGNHLRGKIPLSLANCRELEVLDLGNNQFRGTFPCGLQQIFNLSVLIIRSNEFRGEIGCMGANDSWPMLQIVDVAANSFNGSLKPSFFGSWTAMTEEAQSQSEAKQNRFQLPTYSGYYRDSVTVSGKGNEMKLEKILTIFTCIDFSDNHFEGHIPDSIGDLRSLWTLNFSGNGFTGQIPKSFGNLARLESLDLSSNKLTGKIPDQLSALTFLSFLNLSYNRLEGPIPKGTQLSTFSAESFTGNKALCGAPLNTECNNDDDIARISHMSEAGTSETNWILIAAEIGFTVGLGIAIVPLVFWKRWRIWYYERVDRILLMIFFSRQGRLQPSHPRTRPGN